MKNVNVRHLEVGVKRKLARPSRACICARIQKVELFNNFGIFSGAFCYEQTSTDEEQGLKRLIFFL